MTLTQCASILKTAGAKVQVVMSKSMSMSMSMSMPMSILISIFSR